MNEWDANSILAPYIIAMVYRTLFQRLEKSEFPLYIIINVHFYHQFIKSKC